MTIEQQYLEKYMNPRIKKLFEQANGQFYISPGNQTPRFVFEHNHMLDFVDLIVRECARIADTAEPYQTSDLILKHFGVEP